MNHNVPMGGVPPVNPSGGRGWLDVWMQYAKTRATMTDDLMILSVGLFLMSVVVARRAKLEDLDMPPVYTNLYVMLTAPTTYYHKSTVIRLAQTVLETVAPHLQLPSQMTPEVLMGKLAGSKPMNFEALPKDVQQQELDGVLFAGVRAIMGDEAHKLVNRDYLAPIKDIWLEAYDNPSMMSKEFVKNGRVVVHHPSLSLLLATTPVNLQAVFDGGDTGLFSRMVTVTPESDRVKRVANTRVRGEAHQSPSAVFDGLRKIYNGLPMPTSTSFDEVTVTISDEALEGYNRYADWLHDQCAPDGVLDDKMRGSYGRLGMMGLKVGMLLAMGHGRYHMTADDWGHAQNICERWRVSAHRAREAMVLGGENQLERDILRCLNGSKSARTLVEIAREVGGDRRTIERVLSALKKARMVVQVDRDGGEAWGIEYRLLAQRIYQFRPEYWDDELRNITDEVLMKQVRAELKRMGE